MALAQSGLTRNSPFPSQRKVVPMSAKRELILDPTGRFLNPRPRGTVESPPGELRRLLVSLERICGN